MPLLGRSASVRCDNRAAGTGQDLYLRLCTGYAMQVYALGVVASTARDKYRNNVITAGKVQPTFNKSQPHGRNYADELMIQ